MAKLTAQERRELINGSAEPKLEVLNYRVSLLKAMNWYNVEKERKVRIKYSEVFCKKVGIDSTKVSDSLLALTGSVCRLITRGEPVAEPDVLKITQQLQAAEKSYRKPVVEKQQKQEVIEKPVEDPIWVAANEYIEPFEVAIDENLKRSGAFEFNYNWMAAVTNKKVIQNVLDHIQRRYEEYKPLTDNPDAYIKESYSHIQRRQLNHLVKFFDTIITNLSQLTAVVKVQKKPRKVKEKPAIVLVKNLKYKIEDTEYSLKSLPPTGIIGATQVTLFNTKTRKLSVLNALPDHKLSVKGSSIINIDPTQSFQKTLRKPEEKLKEFIKATKRNTMLAFTSIKSTQNEHPGRVNADVIILNIV